MLLLLAFLVSTVIVGLATDRMTKRIYWLLVALAVITVALYYIPHRFMT